MRGRNQVPVAVTEPVDLSADLGIRRHRGFPVHIRLGLIQRKRNPALVYHAVILFLQLQKDGIAAVSRTVAAHPDLLLVDRTLQRTPDQQIIGSVVIDVADRAFSVLIRTHPALNRVFEKTALPYVQKKLHFVSFKDRTGHDAVTSFVLMSRV